jgi:hypothetical protein
VTPTVDALGSAFRDLLDQEFDRTPGHATALLNGCVFAPSLLYFWFVNGVADFSTAIVLGTVASPAGLQVRLLAYLAAIPTFVALRSGYYLAHPIHRRAVLAGSCPRSDLFSLDWFTVGILVTGLPLAFSDLGLWATMNAVFLFGIFVLPRYIGRGRLGIKLAAIALGLLLFGYVEAGGLLAAWTGGVPEPAAALGPVATLTVHPAHMDFLLRTMNSLLLGPLLVAIVAVALNRVMTHPELTAIPVLHYTLPRRDPSRAVTASAAAGTVFYLGFVAAFTGRLVVVP